MSKVRVDSIGSRCNDQQENPHSDSSADFMLLRRRDDSGTSGSTRGRGLT
jgi:hypothetical protein